MLSKIMKIRDERPKVRRILDAISDFCGRMQIVNCILLFTCMAILIGVPTAIVFLSCSEDVRNLITTIIGGVLSLIFIPLSINYIKRKQKKEDELSEINKPLYEKLSTILIQLLEDGYIAHSKNVENKTVVSNDDENENEVKEIAVQLENFICDNYDKMCNTFPVSLMWDIIEVYTECTYSVTEYINIRVKVTKCFRKMRRGLGAKGLFYINQDAIKMLCANKVQKKDFSVLLN